MDTKMKLEVIPLIFFDNFKKEEIWSQNAFQLKRKGPVLTSYDI